MMHRHGETLVFEGTKQRDVGTNAMGCGDEMGLFAEFHYSEVIALL